MCATCGCSATDQITYTDPATGRAYSVSRALAGVSANVTAAGRPADGARDDVQVEARDHGHEDGHVHRHVDDGWHVHADGTAHSHGHEHGHDHDHEHEHEHDHGHGHDRAHTHEHDRDHGHGYDHGHDHAHEHEHDHSHGHAHPHGTTITLEQQILAKNQLLAERNRGWLAGRGLLALNLVSAPGSGKTTLLERTLRDLKQEMTISVVEGDQATLNDAERIRATGCPVVQINTGTGCHLEADMLAHGLQQLDPPRGSVVLVENVGNLVCPALFDLGERAKVVILSVTEGEDKPLKYPHMFRASEVLLVNKIDLLPHLRFNLEACIGHARSVNPSLRVICVSAQTGAGMGDWYAYLRERSAAARNGAGAR